MADENFANAPKSIGEIKSDKAQDATLWTPRDCLIAMLRDIDSGKMSPNRLCVCWREGEPNTPSTHYSLAGADKIIHAGMLERVKQLILED